jgi:hypothetical protein
MWRYAVKPLDGSVGRFKKSMDVRMASRCARKRSSSARQKYPNTPTDECSPLTIFSKYTDRTKNKTSAASEIATILDGYSAGSKYTPAQVKAAINSASMTTARFIWESNRIMKLLRDFSDCQILFNPTVLYIGPPHCQFNPTQTMGRVCERMRQSCNVAIRNECTIARARRLL